ncbi:MAG: hypothetical protein ACRDJE_05605, partial [Dehalococcoidia bacterium]
MTLVALSAACTHADGSEVRIAPTESAPPVIVTRAEDPPPPSSGPPSPPAERRHVVAPGETIHGIAAQEGTTAA